MRSRITSHPFVKGLLDTFPGAEITAIRPKQKVQDTGVTTAPPEDDDNDTEQG